MSESSVEKSTSLTYICACCAVPFQIIFPLGGSPDISEISQIEANNLNHKLFFDSGNGTQLDENISHSGRNANLKNSVPDNSCQLKPGNVTTNNKSPPQSLYSQVTREGQGGKQVRLHSKNEERYCESNISGHNSGTKSVLLNANTILDRNNKQLLNIDSKEVQVKNTPTNSVEGKSMANLCSLGTSQFSDSNNLQTEFSSTSTFQDQNQNNDKYDQNTKTLNKIGDALTFVFEYPCILKEDTSISVFSKETEDFILCKKCKATLTNLYEIFQEFTQLLNKEGRILKTLEKITMTGESDEPILPMLVYENEIDDKEQSQFSEDDKSTIIKIHDQSENYENLNFSQSTLLNQLRNALKYCTAEEMDAYQQLFQSSKSKKKTSTSKATTKLKRSIRKPTKIRRKSDSVQLTFRHSSKQKKQNKSVRNASVISTNVPKKKRKVCADVETIQISADSENDDNIMQDNFEVDDDENDPTFSPENLSDSVSAEHKTSSRRKRKRGRKPGSGWKRTIKERSVSDAKDDESESQGATSEVSLGENKDVSIGEGDSMNITESSLFPHPPKKKRVRKLAKEYWIEKAKDDPNRTCDICGKVFLYARMMQHHKTTVHEGKKPFECEYCGRGFTQNFILKKHTCDYRLAGGDREYLKIARDEMLFKFSCDECGKRFKERSALVVHQKNHTGETYKCEICDKTFRRPDHLKTHVKIVHSDEKRFVCTTCGQRFKTSSNLRAHERKHANPDQKHLCNICGKSIKTLSQMGRHQKTHEDVLPFECHICGKRFKMKDYLGQHLRKGKSCSSRINNSEEQQLKQMEDNSDQVESQPSTSSTAFSTNNDSNQNSNFHQINQMPYSQNHASFSGQHSILQSSVEFAFALQGGESGGLSHL